MEPVVVVAAGEGGEGCLGSREVGELVAVEYLAQGNAIET